MRTITYSYGLRPSPKKEEPSSALRPTSFRLSVARANRSFAQQTPIEFWREQLAEVPPTLEAPLFHHQNAAFNKTIQTGHFEFSGTLLNQIKAVARSERTTTYTVMLAMWEVLLHGCSDQSEFIVGCARAGTPYSAHERPHMVRASIVSQDSFREVLQKTVKYHTESAPHRGPSMRELADALAPNTPHNRHPIFQTAFIQRHSLTERISRSVLPGTFAPCDIVLLWDETSVRIRGRVEHPLGLIARGISESIPGMFQALTEVCMGNLDTEIGEIFSPAIGQTAELAV
jgi:hypothetical protein